MLEAEGFGVNGKYRFRSRPEGVTLHLLMQTRARQDGSRELLYWQRH